MDGGILVDHELRTSAPDIYAAGDVARFYNPALGKFLRVEHEDNANTMGRAVGRAMAGAPDRYLVERLGAGGRAARAVVGEPGPFRPADLMGRLPAV